MQDIGHDMDDLLRNAATNYPLRVNASNWETIASRLTQVETPAHNRRWTKYVSGLAIFLFLLTGGMFVSREPRQARLPVLAAVRPDQQTMKQAQSRRNTSIAQHLLQTKNAKAGAKKHAAAPTEEIRIRTALIVHPGSSAAIAVNPGAPPSKPGALAAAASPVQKKLSRRNREKFYLGLVAGPEGNQVKGQVMSKWGFDGGLIAGYNFNNRFSLESGMLFTQKSYFTEGRYFNMEMPGMKLESLHGNVTIIEVPLAVKYNFVRSTSGTLFTTAGISSYMLVDETNNYSLVVNGTQQNMTSNYDNASKYFAAAIDLSLGYQLKMGQRLHFRVQPYLKIPLRGIGVGTVPVQSMGAHIGFTYTFR